MTEQPKLCKNCLYYKKSWLGHLFRVNTFDRCYNPIVTGDRVTGDKRSESCKDARSYEFLCGRDGKHYHHKCDKPYEPEIRIDNSGASEWVNSAEYFMSDEGRDFLKQMNKFFNENKAK